MSPVLCNPDEACTNGDLGHGMKRDLNATANLVNGPVKPVKLGASSEVLWHTIVQRVFGTRT